MTFFRPGGPALADSTTRIRHGRPDDLPALTEIYNHYITSTAITFDTSPFTPEERLPWFSQFSPDSRHQLLVIGDHEALLGYACSTRLRPKPAYETSVEVTIYLRPGATGKGLGKQLYAALFAELSRQDLHRCYGVVTLPNDASIALHKSFGFGEVARLNQVGRKFDRYWDTLWMEKPLD